MLIVVIFVLKKFIVYFVWVKVVIKVVGFSFMVWNVFIGEDGEVGI